VVKFGVSQQTSNKEKLWQNYQKYKKAGVDTSSNPDNFKKLMNEDAQFQIYAGDETFRAVLEFTELSQYEEFCQTKGEKWKYYDLWQHYLKKWRGIEENN
jgi:hypothetical protein